MRIERPELQHELLVANSRQDLATFNPPPVLHFEFCQPSFEKRANLIALLDDIAAIAKVAAASLDDVASQAAKAGVTDTCEEPSGQTDFLTQLRAVMSRIRYLPPSFMASLIFIRSNSPQGRMLARS